VFELADKTWFLLAVIVYGLCTIYLVFLWRHGFRQNDRISYSLLCLAFLFHTLAMVRRGLSFNRCPLSNLYEAITFAGWALVLAYLIVGALPRLRFLGAFASPVLLCMGVFALFPDLDTHGPQRELVRGWSSFHAALILLAYGAFGLGSVAGLMYLSQEHDLKFRKLRAVLALMPPIDRLERVIGRLLTAGLLLLTVGLVLGGLTLHRKGPQYTLWDAKVIWSAIVWLIYLTLLILRWRGTQVGRRFAWGAVGSFAFVLLTFWGTNLLSAIHQN
jgi:ABC-type transport system involved in cytochrome c biogenesis permease subunit